MIVRFGEPSKMDMAPYKSLCKVANSSNTVEIYIQMSHDEDNPNWVSMGTFNHGVSDEHIHAAIHQKFTA